MVKDYIRFFILWKIRKNLIINIIIIWEERIVIKLLRGCFF